MQENQRNLPPLQVEDHIALLQTLVTVAWIAVIGAFVVEIWVRLSPLGWPTLNDFPLTYRAMMLEFLVTTGLLSVLLVRRDWYESVPRRSADRVHLLLAAVIAWLGLHLAWSFYVTGGLGGPVLALVPLVVLSALVALPGREGWWTAAYVFGVVMLTLLVERLDLIQSPGPLADAFRYTGEQATPLGVATLMFGFVFAAFLGGMLRRRNTPAGRAFVNKAGLDPTTGLFHHDFLYQRLAHEIARARRHGGDSTLLLVGLDGLTENTADVRAADQRLSGVAGHLLRGVRLYSDTPTRYGLTTLAVLLPTATHEGVHSVVQRIVKSLQIHEPGLPARFGAAMISDPSAVTAEAVMESAEGALRQATASSGPVIVEAEKTA